MQANLYNKIRTTPLKDISTGSRTHDPSAWWHLEDEAYNLMICKTLSGESMMSAVDLTNKKVAKSALVHATRTCTYIMM
jgi:hypothetical protein